MPHLTTRIRVCAQRLSLALVYGLLAGLGFASTIGATEVLNLFAPMPGAAHTDKDGVLATAAESTAHVLDIDFELLASGVVSTGMLLRVEPAPGVVFTATVQRVGMDINAVYYIYAPIEAQQFAYLGLSVDDATALGQILLPLEQLRYHIRYDAPKAVHVSSTVMDHELDELPCGINRVSAPDEEDKATKDMVYTANAEAFVEGDPSAPATIDLMVVYTPAARTWASNQGGIASVINQAVVVNGQAALDNSLTGITLNLVHTAEVNYTENPNDSPETLERLRITDDGHMDIVHTWRNTYGADVVAILAQVNDTGGLAYALESQHLPNGFPAAAFSLTRVQQAAGTFTFVHEIGHNMGAGHHHEQLTQPGPQLSSYSSGHRWTGYCTVMAYESGYADDQSHARIPYFSNPSVSYQGTPTGHATLADNARTLRETKHLTAAYRATVSTTPINLRAVALDNRVMLRWADPQSLGFGSKTVHIRFSTTTYPTTLSEGTQVYQGTDLHVLHTSGIVSGQPHYYTIWVSHDGSTFIQP